MKYYKYNKAEKSLHQYHSDKFDPKDLVPGKDGLNTEQRQLIEATNRIAGMIKFGHKRYGR